jgi:hypothetical protein
VGLSHERIAEEYQRASVELRGIPVFNEAEVVTDWKVKFVDGIVRRVR